MARAKKIDEKPRLPYGRPVILPPLAERLAARDSLSRKTRRERRRLRVLDNRAVKKQPGLVIQGITHTSAHAAARKKRRPDRNPVRRSGSRGS